MAWAICAILETVIIVVNATKQVRGEIHHERRLHRLLMIEEAKMLERGLATQPEQPDDSPPLAPPTPASYEDINRTLTASVSRPVQSTDPLAQYRSPKYSTPEVQITTCNMSGYWLVAIQCKDRSKLLFDTVCTLADLEYDVFHATIDSQHGVAIQEYYIRYLLCAVSQQI